MQVKEGYTRISSILGQWDKFGHIDPAVLAHKCEVGTRVHNAIDKDDTTETVCLAMEDERGYFESYLLWKKTTQPIWMEKERRFYCDKLKITGAVDAIIQVSPSPELIIVDYKTSAQESPKSWALQACFYNYLAVMNNVAVSPRVLFVKLDKEGKAPKVFEYQYTKELMNVCISALNCYRYLNA